MARTKHERMQQRKRERRTKTGEDGGGEEGSRNGGAGEEQAMEELAVERSGGGGADDGETRTTQSGADGGAPEDTASRATAEKIVDEEKRVGVPVEDRGGVTEASIKKSGEGDERGEEEEEEEEEEEDANAARDELPGERASASTAQSGDQDTDTERACSERDISQDAIDSLLVRLEAEISTRMAQQTKTTETAESAHSDQAATEAQLCIHEEQLQRLQTELESVERHAEMLAAENVEWKRASEKQQHIRAENQAVHVLRRTQAAQLRRVAKTLETADAAALSGSWGILSSLHEIANALYPSESTEDAKDAHHETSGALVFPAKLASSCACGRGSRHWPVKQEDGGFSDEYAFQVFRLTEEPLKKRCYASLESLDPMSASCKIDDESHAIGVASLLKEHKRQVLGRYVYEPPKAKRSRIRTKTSSERDLSSADDGDLSDASLEVALAAVDPETPVHPGSEDGFLMIAL